MVVTNPLRIGLALLSLALLFFFARAQAEVLPDERIDIMYHSYEGGGTQIDGPAILVRKNLGNSVSISGQYYVDSISGASIDVVAARGADVESGASPYAEERKQKDLGLVYLHDRTTFNLGYSTSKENDFDSTTYSFSVSQTFFGDLTTVSLNTSFGDDIISRNDDHTGEFGEREAERRRYSINISQILTKNLIAALSVESAVDEGYLQNPYRVMRFCTNGDGVNPVCSEAREAAEKYPNTHNSDAVGVRAIYYLPYRAAIRADYREFSDSWGIEASNYEVRYTHPYKEWLFELKYRAYEQTEADFYSDLFPYADYQNFMGRDKELSPLTTTTFGLGVTYQLPTGFVPWFDKSTVNLYWDRIQFDYEDFRRVVPREEGVLFGQEPLYNFDADVIRLYWSFWY
ncbi:DUF3570 domain-containing protein [Cellvibrio sp. ARAG 10.3]|uniref:DUF3570 domain-containing protein n=1 Tax=Cellvibrio sp. ARAG 10.3 TaxID=3451358 RepID=UPI003F4646DA